MSLQDRAIPDATERARGRARDAGIPDDLLDWIAATAGGSISGLERLTTVREAWYVDVAAPARAPRQLVLRCKRPEGFGIGASYTLEREVQILRALAPTAVPVPRVRGYNRVHEAALLDRMPGRADFHHIADAAERERVADHFMELLAALHRLAPEELNLQELPLPATPQQHALLDLNTWERLYRDAAREADPLLSFALAWLRRNVPAQAGRTALIQGDTGPGQFLFDGGRVTAVLDWELAHFGDPMEDLAWICCRDLFTPFGALPERFRRYAALSGNPIDLDRLRYYRVSALLRTSLATALALEELDSANDIAQILTWHSVTQRALCESLADALGMAIEPAAIPELPPPTPRSPIFDVVRDTLRGDVLPALEEPYRAHRLTQALGLLAHLRLAERLGPQLDARERDELADLLGHVPATPAESRAALVRLAQESGAARERSLLAYFTHREQRVHALLAPAMGEQASSALSPIEDDAR